MAGLTERGLEIKRLSEIVVDLKEQAIPIFQDLVQPGDVVDTSDSSTLGRLIGLYSLPLSDLWELAQQVNSAFDPNAATGVSLENLVMYLGLTRNPASATTATVEVWGDPSTNIGIDNVVRSTDNNLYNISQPILLDNSACIGARMEIASVEVDEAYTVSLSIGQTTRTATYVALVGDTIETILTQISNTLTTIPSPVTARVEQGYLIIEAVNIFTSMNITTSSNILITKIKARGEVTQQEVGDIPQKKNEINTIATPLLGWDSVNNPFDAVEGRNQETDDQLRTRFRDSKYTVASNISDSLYSTLLGLDSVIGLSIYENETSTPIVEYDLPPHSFKVVIEGGNPSEIAEGIWRNKPLGIGAVGNTSGTITDSQGIVRSISFERPIPARIYIDLEIEVTNESEFPFDGVEQIKAQLIDYFENNMRIGSDVIYSRLYTPINKVAGHQVNSLLIGTTTPPGETSNLDISYNEIASLNDADISITVV